MSRDINVDMAVKYQREIDTMKDEKTSLIQMVAKKDAEIERLKSCLSPAYVEPRQDGRDLVMTKLVKKHVFNLRKEVGRLRNALENLLLDAPSLLRLARNHGLREALTFANAIADARAAIGRGHAESQPVDRVIFDRALAGLPLLNLRIPMPPVKKP